MKQTCVTLAHEGEGLSDIYSAQSGWDLLILNPLERLKPGKVAHMHKHTETDECFVLTSGRALLLTADGEDAPAHITVTELEIGKPSLALCGVWHANIMSDDAKIVLIENSGTTEEKTVRLALSPEKKKEVDAIGLAYFGA